MSTYYSRNKERLKRAARTRYNSARTEVLAQKATKWKSLSEEGRQERRDYMHEWRRTHPEAYARAKEGIKRWRLANPEKVKAQRAKDNRKQTLRRHKLTEEQFTEMAKTQGYRCAVCRDSVPKGRWKKLQVDHDHRTGKRRGLLCQNCNILLGLANDNINTLLAAAAYLGDPKQV